jgi:hypothetical protein
MMAENDEMRRTRHDGDKIGGLQVYRGGSMFLDSHRVKHYAQLKLVLTTQ